MWILFLILVIELIVIFQVYFIFTKTDFLATVLPNVLVDLANTDRTASQLQSLKTNSALEQAARLKAEDMAQKSYFSHSSPDGKTPWYWLDRVGYSYTAAGENLAVNFFDSQDIEAAWMNSASHRANILNSKFTEIGIATTKGIYKGNETIFVVQFFGKPAIAAVEPVKSSSGTREIKPSSSKPKAESIKPQETVAGKTDVAGNAPKTEELFIDIGEQNKTAIVIKNAGSEPIVDVVVPMQTKNSFKDFLRWEKIFSTPRAAANLVYIALGAIILLALLLKISVKFSIQHPVLILNGVIILIVISSLLYFNYHIFVSNAVIF